jgi:hypothetical protein
MDITKASIEQLHEEILRRKSQKPIKPAPLVHPNFDVLRKNVNEYLIQLGLDEWTDADKLEWADAIFEAAINSIYEPSSIWRYITKMEKWHKEDKGE